MDALDVGERSRRLCGLLRRLVSVGQQAFFGLGAYLAIQLSYHGIAVYPALLLGALVAGIASLPISYLMLRLRAGEFAIGMWVVAELAHLLVALDPLINGETGVSMIALGAYRRALGDRVSGIHPTWRQKFGRKTCRDDLRSPIQM